jgi:hypothetical protein
MSKLIVKLLLSVCAITLMILHVRVMGVALSSDTLPDAVAMLMSAVIIYGTLNGCFTVLIIWYLPKE